MTTTRDEALPPPPFVMPPDGTEFTVNLADGRYLTMYRFKGYKIAITSNGCLWSEQNLREAGAVGRIEGTDITQ